MGFDLYGNNKRAKDISHDLKEAFKVNDKDAITKLFEEQDKNPGGYFRNNVWWWRPLWQYVAHSCSDLLTEEDIERGHYNDGHLIGSRKATAIGKRLLTLVASGQTAQWHKERQDYLDKLPDEQCEICKGTGVRNDKIVQGTCNACSGKGTRRPYEAEYPFSVENVQEFAQFAIESKGFRIC